MKTIPQKTSKEIADEHDDKSELYDENGKLIVVDHETGERVEVSPELQAALEEGLAQADRGEYITAEQLFEELKKMK